MLRVVRRWLASEALAHWKGRLIPEPRRQPRSTNPTGERATPDLPPARRERGVALILVVAGLAMIMPLMVDFGYRTNVDWQSAVNQGDEIRARNVERGAMRLSILMFELQRMVFNKKQFREFVGNIDVTQVAPYLMSVFGSKDGLTDIGGLAGVQTSALGDFSLGENLQFEVRLEAESGRVNVNCLAQGAREGDKNRAQERTILTLSSIMQPVLYNPLFEEEKSNGQRYRREDVLGQLVDYIDDDRSAFDPVRMTSSSQNESARTEQLRDPYQYRNARIDSIDELHLVEGIDDDWMAAFGGYLTAWGECKVNLNFASPELIATVIASTVTPEDEWKVKGDNFLLNARRLANFVVQSREFSLFKETKDFAELVAHPDQFMSPLSSMLSASGGSALAAERDAQVAELNTYIPQGVNLVLKGAGGENADSQSDDSARRSLDDVATVKPEHVYRLEITTSVGAVRKRLTAVYDLNFARTQKAGKGAWLYVREE
jgi:type II secretory pathway component PulK